MSHQIVVEHMKGNIFAKNIEIIKNKKVYKGCSIIIVLPIIEKHIIENLEDYII